MFMFFSTWRTSRGGLGASITVMTKEALLKNLEERKYWSQLRFAEVGEDGVGTTQLLNGMTVEQFDRCFSPDDFTSDEVDKYFNVEVRKVYGNKKEKPTYIKTKDLQVGHVYSTEGNSHYLYLGRVRITKEGFTPVEGFLKTAHYRCTKYDMQSQTHILDSIENILTKAVLYDDLTKTCSKFVSTTDRASFIIPKRFESVIVKPIYGRYGTEKKQIPFTIEFLDVK